MSLKTQDTQYENIVRKYPNKKPTPFIGRQKISKRNPFLFIRKSLDPRYTTTTFETRWKKRYSFKFLFLS